MKAFLALSIALISIGCEGEDSISTYSIPKEDGATAARPEVDSAVAAKESDSTTSPLITWDDPPRAKRMPSRTMRVVTFGVDGAPDLDFYVSAFGPESGEVLSNVNRWENQLGLPATPAQEISTKTASVACSLGSWVTVYLLAPDRTDAPRKAMLAGLLPAGGRIWFVKMIGPANQVYAHRSEFEALITSFRADAAKSVVGIEPASRVVNAPDRVPAESDGIPPAWIAQPPKAMRVASYWTDETRSTEVVVTQFGANAFGDLLSNFNRWRAMAELPAVADVSEVESEAFGQNGTVYDFTGADKRIRVAMIRSGDTVHFVRLSGPTDQVAKALPDLKSYLSSRKWP